VIDEAGNSWQSQPQGSGDRFKSRIYKAVNEKMHLDFFSKFFVKEAGFLSIFPSYLFLKSILCELNLSLDQFDCEENDDLWKLPYKNRGFPRAYAI
jgi:hypothetical protein